MSVGNRIKELREMAGFSQRELAAKMDVSRNYLGRVERGEQPPSERLLELICKATGADRWGLSLAAGIVPADLQERIVARPVLVDLLRVCHHYSDEQVQALVENLSS